MTFPGQRICSGYASTGTQWYAAVSINMQQRTVNTESIKKFLIAQQGTPTIVRGDQPSSPGYKRQFRNQVERLLVEYLTKAYRLINPKTSCHASGFRLWEIREAPFSLQDRYCSSLTWKEPTFLHYSFWEGPTRTLVWKSWVNFQHKPSNVSQIEWGPWRKQ